MIRVVLLLGDGLERPGEYRSTGASEESQGWQALLQFLDFALRDLQRMRFIVVVIVVVVISSGLLANSVNQIGLCQVNLLVQPALAQDLVE